MEIIEYLIPFSLFIFGTFIFSARNPVYGVLSFIVVVAHVVLLLISLNLEFLAYVLAIVYIGAIVVLFLFVIMMFYIREHQKKYTLLKGVLEYVVLGFFVSTLLFFLSFVGLFEYTDYTLLILKKPFFNTLSYLLFNDYAILTVVAALLMFLGVLGSVVLTIKKTTPLYLTKTNPAVLIRSSLREVIKNKN